MVAATLPDQDLTIEELWSEAEENFKQITGGKNLNLRSKDGLEEVMSRLQAKYGSATSGDHAKTKRIVNNVITAIKSLGGIAVKGVSMVFGPADLCFSAITFLLEIPSRIDKVFGGIGAVFEALENALLRLEIYKRIEKSTKLPHELLHSTNRILCKFVEVCALAYGLAFGSTAAKWRAKMLAGLCDDDSGVSGALKQFNELIDRQLALESSLNLESTLMIEKNTQLLPDVSSGIVRIQNVLDNGMETLVNDTKKRSMNKITEDQRAFLMKALDLSEEVLSEQDNLLEVMRAESFDDSGTSLQKHPDYQRWIDPASDAHPVLFLAGDAHSGKSFLAQAAFDMLKSLNASDPEKNAVAGKLVISRYFFQTQNERTSTAEKKWITQNDNLLETALRHICFQITQQNKAYAKEITNLAKIFKLKGKSMKDLWEILSLGHPVPEVCHVLVLDGLDHVSESEAQRFYSDIVENIQSTQIKPQAQPNFRLLVSSVPKFIPINLSNIPRLDAVVLNENNIQHFIERGLEPGKVWQEETSQTKELAEFIRAELPSNVKGDFAVVMQALDAVKEIVKNGGDLAKAKNALLDACKQKPMEIAANIIDELSKSLSVSDITRLNNLLCWVIHGRSWFLMKHLRAASYLEFGEDPCQSFETIVRTKFGRLLNIDSDGYVAAKDEVEEYFSVMPTERQQTAPEFDGHEPRITMEIKVQNASITQVRKFLWSLTEQAVMDPTIFKITNTEFGDKTIHAHRVDCLVYMTVKMLDLLVDEVNEITEPMFEHGMDRIVHYLDILLKDEIQRVLSPDELKTILSGIINFLSEPDGFPQHRIMLVHARFSWLVDFADQPCHPLHKWLTMEKAVKLLHRRDARRLKSLLSSDDGHLSFLVPFTKMVVEVWLQSDKVDASDGYYWVDDFLQKGLDWTMKLADKENLDALPLQSAERVQRALAWAEKQHIPHKKNDLYYQRIGETYSTLHLYLEAIESFRIGMKSSDTNWQLREGCALAYAGLEEFKPATEEMLDCLRIIEDTLPGDLKKETGFSNKIILLTQWYLKSERFQDAIKVAEETLVADPLQYEVQSCLLEATWKSGDFNRLDEYFKVDLTATNVDGKPSKLFNLMEYLAADDFDRDGSAYFDKVIVSAAKAGATPKVLEVLRELTQIQRAQDDHRYRVFCQMLEGWVQVFGRSDRTMDDIEQAIELMEGITQNAESRAILQSGNDKMKRTLGLIEDVLIESYQCRLLASLGTAHTDEDDIEKMKTIIAKARSAEPNNMPSALSKLAGYYVAIEQKQKARELLRPFIEDYLGMLVDDTEENDLQAFIQLALTLTTFGDDYNALTAWSQYTPFDANIKSTRHDSSLQGEFETDAGTTNGTVEPKMEHVNIVKISPGIGDDDDGDDQKDDEIQFQLSDTGEVCVNKDTNLIKLKRDLISPTTLNLEKIPWEIDTTNPDYVLTTVWINPTRYKRMIAHTKKLRFDNSMVKFYMTCAARCGKEWSYADDIYVCRYCHQVWFCSSCLESVKLGKKSEILVCNRDHDWLHVPRWSWRRFDEVGHENVRVDGTIDEDGYTVGGRIVHFQEWLNNVRRDWGFKTFQAEYRWVQKIRKSVV